jgi:cell division protein FtsZ
MKTKTSTQKNLAIKIIAIGGAGRNLAQHLATRGLGELPCAMIDTGDAGAADWFALDARTLRELDVANGVQAQGAFAAHSENLKAWCAGADVVCILTGLGGKAGSGISAVAARVAKEAGALVLGFATLPFECEGSRRAQQAQKGLERFKAEADGVICLPNQKVCRLIDENTSLLDTFKISNELLTDGLRGVWQLLSYGGLIEIHFDDLRDLVRDVHAESLFATAEASGANRAREVVDKLLAHPLFDGGRALTEAKSALVSIVGGTGLAMGEVNRVMEQINRHCEGAQVLMGAAVDETFHDRISVTVIAARRDKTLGNGAEHGAQFLNPDEVVQTSPRFVPQPPSLPQEKMEELAAKQPGGTRRARRGNPKMRQEQLPLEVVSKGRFEKSEPTIRNGEDLDEPTYVRRGMVLN